VVSGSFRNISGTVTSIDTGSSTLVVKDLATKKQVTVHVTPDAQMRRLPERMAQALATRLKGSTNAPGAGNGGAQEPSAFSAQGQRNPGGSPSAGASRLGGQSDGSGQGGGGGQWGRQNGGQGGAGGGSDPQQMLNRAPTIQLADLQKGEAVMLVSTEGAAEVTAITLLAGVEPLLQAPAASQNLLSNWSMGSGGAEAAAAQ